MVLESSRYEYGEREIELEFTVDLSDDPPTVDHITNDLMNAAEEDNFAIETPRVHVGQDHFETVEVSKKSGPQQMGQLVCQPGPPMLEVGLEWTDETSDLYEDFNDHMNCGDPIALYGDMHVWNVDDPVDGSIEAMFDVSGDDVGFICDTNIGWRDFAVAGWR